MSQYVLEDQQEFDRLERQSKTQAYNFKKELSEFSPKKTGHLLDAGCGSGIVTRYLAERFPKASVIGCDASTDRINQAKPLGKLFKNCQFQVENLRALSFADQSLDGIVCRFVLEHLNGEQQREVIREFFRCLKPGGKLCLIDIEGYLYNVYPQTPLMSELFHVLDQANSVDLKIGKKLPNLVNAQGFSHLQWKIETHDFQGEAKQVESQLIRERFDQTLPALTQLLGSLEKAKKFTDEYLTVLNRPDAVLFYNKFIVQAEKPKLKSLKLVR